MITLTVTRAELEEMILGVSKREATWLRYCRRKRDRDAPLAALRALSDKLLAAIETP